MNTKKNISTSTTVNLSMEENISLDNELRLILQEHNLHVRIKKLTLLRTRYYSPLSLSHIDYYIHKFRKQWINQIWLLVTLSIIVFYALFTVHRIANYYERFNNLDVSENTLQKAISYYNSGDYEAASVRLRKLYNNGWDNYTTVYYLSQIYQEQQNYDAAAELLMDNLINGYGVANITTENRIFTELRDIWVNQSLSNEIFNRVTETLDQVHSYSPLYAQAYVSIADGDYENAEYYCQSLEAAGADGFQYAAYYTTVLVNTNRIQEAYNLVMNTVRRTSRTAEKISTNQRIALVNYITPHLQGAQLDDCNKFLYEELEKLETLNNTNTAEPFISYDDIEFLFTTNTSIQNLNYFESIDEISIEKETTLVNGRECYYIKSEHYDGANSNLDYFFMDMEQDIYIFMDGKYHLLPKDEPSDPGDTNGTIQRKYSHYDYPNISLNFYFDSSNVSTYEIRDNDKNSVIFTDTEPETSPYGAFTYLNIEDTNITIFFTATDAIVIVTKDPNQKYSYLEGRYILSE